jgi:protein-L-isoaspartate(D-aspartate) O-methyltransferase
MNIEQARFNMIEQQIRPWDVLDTSVLDLLKWVKREDFVPAAHKAQALMDLEIPLGEGRSMLCPKVEARMVQELKALRHETALVIGEAGTYLAALLSHKASRVVLLQSGEEAVAAAQAIYRSTRTANVQVVQGPALAGVPQQGPFDLVVLTGSVAEVPKVLFDQLKPHGRLLAIVGQAPIMQAVLYTKEQGSAPSSRVLFETLAPRLAGYTEPSRFRF